MNIFGKNRFISFFALLLVLTLALSMNSVFAADTAATGTDSAVQQESGEPPASEESDSAVSVQNPEQNQEQKPENSASPENPTTRNPQRTWAGFRTTMNPLLRYGESFCHRNEYHQRKKVLFQ